MKISSLHFTILFLLFPLFLFAQKNPIKYGKLSDKEKSIKKSKIDPEASAIILCDFGEINFEGNNVIITRHTRIKILNQNGLEKANIEIPYFAKKGSEKITRIKAQTLNIDKKGKIEKTKISKSDFYTIDINENWKSKRFAFPNVKPGSIIEYSFTKISKDAVSLEEWSFQNDIPTLKSHLNVFISEGLDYKIVLNGSQLLKKYQGESRNTWVLENLPPLEEEDYCPNIDNYKESIRFQLASYKTYNQTGSFEDVTLMSTWEQLSYDLLKHKDFIGILGQKRKSKIVLEKIISDKNSDLKKVKKIYSYVQKKISWDGRYRLFPDQRFSQVFDKKIGNSSDINLCLVRLLKSAGLDANPLIISTKNNGWVTKVYPLYNQFNHVLAQVKIGDEDILLDAIGNFRPYNLISEQDLNSNGYLLNGKDSRWIEIPLPKKTRTIIVTELDFNEEEMKYKTSFSFFEHEAVKFRQLFHEEKGEKTFVTNHLIDLSDDDFVLDSFSVKNGFDFDKPLSVICFLKKPLEDGLDADYLYIDPFIKKHFAKNPFIKPYRYLPVDFILPSKEKFIFNLRIPDGYELAEEPKSARFTIENKKSDYNYLFKTISNSRAQLSSEFIISDPLIYPSEYGSLREMFNEIIKHQSTQIVLKKK